MAKGIVLNEVGGKIKKDEEPICAMMREFREETGLSTTPKCWVNFVDMVGEDFTVHFYYSVYKQHRFNRIKPIESEKVYKLFMNDFNSLRTIPNLRWLIPLALEIINGGLTNSKIAKLPIIVNELTTKEKQ